MAASYKRLFKLLIDREMKSKELAEKAGISPATLAKMKKDGCPEGEDLLVWFGKLVEAERKSDSNGADDE